MADSSMGRSEQNSGNFGGNLRSANRSSPGHGDRRILEGSEAQEAVDEVERAAVEAGGFMVMRRIPGGFRPERATVVAEVDGELITFCLTIEDQQWLVRGADLLEALVDAIEEGKRS